MYNYMSREIASYI